MRLTKFVHACLLAETPEYSVLFDPGNFSWESGVFDISNLEKLDCVVITHEHADHFSEPFVRTLADKFPDVPFITTPSVAEKLKGMGISNASSQSNDFVEVFSTKPHATMEPIALPPENIAVHFADKLTVGGDRHDLEETKDILALTITAPWGSVRAAAEMALRLKPKSVLPIHDWHWNDDARQAEYARSGAFYGDHGITLIRPTDGKPIEVS